MAATLTLRVELTNCTRVSQEREERNAKIAASTQRLDELFHHQHPLLVRAKAAVGPSPDPAAPTQCDLSAADEPV